MAASLHISQLHRVLLQFPPVEWALQRFKELLLGALRQGPVPEHVAFVMDGNRRFARKNRIEIVDGHNMGFEALAKVPPFAHAHCLTRPYLTVLQALEVCYKIGVRVVTVYAFSIENFKRSKFEVEALLDMAKVKLTQLAQHGELLERYGAKMQFLGQRDMIRADVLEQVDKAIDMTKDNRRYTTNHLSRVLPMLTRRSLQCNPQYLCSIHVAR